MTLGDIANKARSLTYTDINSYTDADLLIDINIWYHKVVTMILESMDESYFDDARYSNYPIQTTPMEANQRDYTMPISEKVLKIRRVDVTYDGTNWRRATPMDDGQTSAAFGNDTTLDSNFNKDFPRYSVKYNSYWLYPMPLTADAVSGLIRVEWERQAKTFTSADYTSVLTDSTAVPGFDDPFHPMISTGAAYERCLSRGLPQLQALQTQLTDYETRLRQAYGRKNLDVELTLQNAYDDRYGR